VRFDTVFLPEQDILSVRVQGTGDADTVSQLVVAIRSAPEFRAGMGVLIDALGTDYAPTAQDARTLPGYFEEQLPGSRLAVLVRNYRQYAIASLVESLAKGRDIQFAVFPDRAEAIRWLTETKSSDS
jgi:hypothetical protein